MMRNGGRLGVHNDNHFRTLHFQQSVTALHESLFRDWILCCFTQELLTELNMAWPPKESGGL